jgi:segregation and condensation protein B
MALGASGPGWIDEQAFRHPDAMDRPDIPASLLRLAEALVFASPQPATWRLLAPFVPANVNTDDVFLALQAHCAERGVVLVHQADGWVFQTASDLNAKLRAALGETRGLSRAAFEVLVVIAFHQPITRPEIEAVRGVSLAQATMELLLETGLIAAHGRKQAPGTPTLWVTTPLFLTQFGLKSLRDLPGSDVMMAIPPARKRGTPSHPAEATPPSDAEAAEQSPADLAPD